VELAATARARTHRCATHNRGGANNRMDGSSVRTL